MKNKEKKDCHNLTELEVKLLKEQRRKIVICAAFASAGVIDLTLLKMLSKTIGTDDIAITDLLLLLLGGGTSFLGVTLGTTSTIDYLDMKNSFYKDDNSKKRVREKSKK